MKLKLGSFVSKRNEKIIYHGFREMQALFGFFFGFFWLFPKSDGMRRNLPQTGRARRSLE